jgi:PilZ domain
MQESDRRYRQRFDLKVPLKIRSIDSPGLPQQSVESSDISARGLYFSTDAPLEVGTRVEMFLSMPEEISGKDSPLWRCTGRIVRLQPAVPVERKAGNGVEIQYYDVIGISPSDTTGTSRFEGILRR